MGDLLPVRQRTCSIQDDSQYAIQIVTNVGIGETQNQIALMGQIEVPVPIFDRVVAIVINFHDEADKRA